MTQTLTGRSKQSIQQRKAFGIGCKYDSHSRLQLEYIAYQRDALLKMLRLPVGLIEAGERDIDAELWLRKAKRYLEASTS